MSNGSAMARQSEAPPEPDRRRRGESGALQALYQYRYLIFLWVAMGIAAGAAYWAYAPRWYESSARVLLLPKDPDRLEGTTDTKNAGISEDILADHVQVLQSARIVSTALEKNSLTELPSILEQLQEDETSVEYVIDHLEISTGGEGSARTARVINIGFRHVNPVDAEKVLTAVVEEYKTWLNEKYANVAKEAATLIDEARVQSETDLAEAQKQLLDFRLSSKLLSQDGLVVNPHATQVITIQAQLNELDLKAFQVRTRRDLARQELARMDAEGSSPMERMSIIDAETGQRLEVFGTIVGAGVASQTFQAQQPERLAQAEIALKVMLELQGKERELLSDFGPAHPDVKKVRQSIELTKEFLDEWATKNAVPKDEFELSAKNIVNTYMGMLENDVKSTELQRLELEKKLVIEEAAATELVEAEETQETLRGAVEREQSLYDAIMDRLRSVDMAQNFSGFFYEMIQDPKIGVEVWPDLFISLLAGMMLGLVAGSTNAIVNFSRRKFFENSEEIEDLLDTTVLAEVPSLMVSKEAIKGADKAMAGFDPTLAVPLAHFSHGSESIRHMRTLVMKAFPGEQIVLGTTSAVPGDGKSTVTANLAASLAQRGRNVLLIDADLRRPRQHKLFGVGNEIGLADVLTGKMSVDECTIHTPVEGLALMPAGEVEGDPGDVLDRADLTALIERVSRQYDTVLFDLPPVLAVADPCIVARHVPKMMVVVRPAADDRRQTMSTIEKLRSVGADVLGIAVNCWDAQTTRYFRRSYESSVKYGYGKYGGHYYTSDKEKQQDKEKYKQSLVERSNGQTGNSNGHTANSGPHRRPVDGPPAIR